MKRINYIACFLLLLSLTSTFCFFLMKTAYMNNSGFVSLYESSKNCGQGFAFTLQDGNYLYIEANADKITFNLIDTKTKSFKKINELKREFKGFSPNLVKLSDDNFLIALKRSVKENKSNLRQALIYLYDYNKNSLKELNILPNDLVFREIYNNGNVITGVAAKNDFGCPDAEEIINYDFKNNKIVSKLETKNANFCAISNLENGKFLLYEFTKSGKRLAKDAFGIYDSARNQIIMPSGISKPIIFDTIFTDKVINEDKFLLREPNGSGSIYSSDFKLVKKFADDEKILGVKDGEILVRSYSGIYLYNPETQNKKFYDELNYCDYTENGNVLYERFVFNCRNELKIVDPKTKILKKHYMPGFHRISVPSFFFLDKEKTLIFSLGDNYILNDKRKKIKLAPDLAFKKKDAILLYADVLNSGDSTIIVYRTFSSSKTSNEISEQNFIEIYKP